MTVALRISIALAPVLLLLGCGPRVASIAPTPGAAEAAATGSGEVLLWGAVGGAPPRSYRLAVGDQGRVIAEEEGLWIATTGGEWQWETLETESPSTPCYDEEERAGTSMRAFLRPRDGVAARQHVVVPDVADLGGLNDFGHRATVQRSLGPYLFIHEETTTHMCGSPGGFSSEFKLWNVERGQAVHWRNEATFMFALRGKAGAILNEGEDEWGAAWKAEGPPELVQLLLKYDERARPSLDAEFARPAPQGETDGDWSSYTRSTILPSGWLPPWLKPFAEPPASVVAFLERHPGFELGGWSTR